MAERQNVQHNAEIRILMSISEQHHLTISLKTILKEPFITAIPCTATVGVQVKKVLK